jgi:hypothetical protein
LGDNDHPYIPPDEPNVSILGYVAATVTVKLDNSAMFDSLKLRFSPGSLTGNLQASPMGVNLFKGFDMWSHDKSGKVQFQLTNPAFNYDTGKMSASWTGNVGGSSVSYVDVSLPNGPAIKHHGTYQLSAWLYDEANSLQDTITVSVNL